MSRIDRTLRSGRRRRAVAGAIVAVVGAVALSACGDAHDGLTCRADLGATTSKLALATDDGASGIATVAGYQVVISVRTNNPRMAAEVKDPAGTTIFRSYGGGLGAFSGSTTTPDGTLAFSCT